MRRTSGGDLAAEGDADDNSVTRVNASVETSTTKRGVTRAGAASLMVFSDATDEAQARAGDATVSLLAQQS